MQKEARQEDSSFDVGDTELDEAKALLATAQARIAVLEEGNLAKARELYENALAIYSKINNQVGIGDAQHSLGKINESLGELEKAVSHLKEALQVFRDLKERGRIAEILNNLGEIHIERRDYKQAEAHLKEALKIRRELDDKR